jgi:hypothetical protein
MPKPDKPSVADQFSDDDMNKIKHYGQMLGGGVTPFDEAVEDALNKRQAAREVNAGKMHAAQTSGGDEGLGPSGMDTAAIKQRDTSQQQAAAQGAHQAQQAQSQSAPVNAPAAPSGPVGTTKPYAAQEGPQPPPSATQGLPPPGESAGPPPAPGDDGGPPGGSPPEGP